ncbi:MAG: hypothetical protein E6I93_06960 [Chloroflexi bacterium]|nr:MAG: hypothetical protein E6I93_06960 [Chloroflexota bacterium]
MASRSLRHRLSTATPMCLPLRSHNKS